MITDPNDELFRLLHPDGKLPIVRQSIRRTLDISRCQLGNALVELNKRATGEVRSRGDDVETEACVAIALAQCVETLRILGPNELPRPRHERARRVLIAFADRLGQIADRYEGPGASRRVEAWAKALIFGIGTFAIVTRPLTPEPIALAAADWYIREGTLLPGLGVAEDPLTFKVSVNLVNPETADQAPAAAAPVLPPTSA